MMLPFASFGTARTRTDREPPSICMGFTAIPACIERMRFHLLFRIPLRSAFYAETHSKEVSDDGELKVLRGMILLQCVHTSLLAAIETVNAERMARQVRNQNVSDQAVSPCCITSVLKFGTTLKSEWELFLSIVCIP